jgi:adenylate cyclase
LNCADAALSGSPPVTASPLGWVLQVADIVLPAMGVAEWTLRFLIGVLVLGLPLAIAIAWAFDVSPDGILRTDDNSDTTQPRPLRSRYPVALALAVIAAVLMAILLPRSRPEAAAGSEWIASIAVLPFVNVSADLEQEYFSDGITEELHNELAQIPGLRVPARTSAFAFKGQSLPVSKIAQRLNVDHLLGGSVRRSGDRVRISAHLVDARTDGQLWSEIYKRDMADVFVVQMEIARSIVTALQLRLPAPRGQRCPPTESRVAHDLYLRGRFELNRRGENLTDAISLFEAAIAEDPEYADAYGALALSYALAPRFRLDLGVDADERARSAAARAIALNPLLSEPHTAMGFLLRPRSPRSAEPHLRRAIDLNPADATAHNVLAQVLVDTGRWEEAVAEADRAVGLDPSTVTHRYVRGVVLSRARRFADAEIELREAYRMDPNFLLAREEMSNVFLATERYDSAVVALAESRSDLYSLEEVRAIIGGIADASLRAGALSVIQALHSQGRISIFGVAVWAARLGERELALSAAEETHRQGLVTPAGMIRPHWDQLRSEPRIQSILREVDGAVLALPGAGIR